MSHVATNRRRYAYMTIAAVVGMVASFLQTLEKLTLLRNKDALLSCNLNSVFSCSNVLNAWQSSVLGFPNSILCLVLFTMFFAAALAGLSGGVLSRRFRFGIQGLSLFTLGFAIWFLAESIFVIHAICIFCLFCYAGLLVVNGMWLRINAPDYNLKRSWRKKLDSFMGQGGDVFIWLVLAILLIFSMLLKFA